MKFNSPLIQATLIKRYKRFLADVRLKNGEEITVHCPNTGSMKACWEPEWTVYLEDSNNPKRKYQYTWTIAETPSGERIGVNTHLANKLVEEAISAQLISELSNYDSVHREVKYGSENSRIDFLLKSKNRKPAYVEVKSVTLKEDDGIGYFPDAVSARGQKHLRELIELVKDGENRAILLFCVQHTGISKVKAAAHIDPDYAKLLKEAHQAGVEIIAYGVDISPEEMVISREITVCY
ncbi:DNA/RNA nuclease SfsA [Pleionea sediminis]|uniref:DNA/RNA nuclease SfsA n=1 Tax=Pleionea sediminis TaxID=2569479 RepID=UPI0011853547|nr:DNA/RNA nuclease SfsA [Pleionea sediminis]